MKQVEAIWATDLHTADKTIDVCTKIFGQLIDKAVEYRCRIFLGGDIFTSRQKQSLQVLKVFENFLGLALLNKVDVYGIPGNHDKVDYFSEESWLHLFQFHPAFNLITDCEALEVGDTVFNFIPYFDESIYDKYLDMAVRNVDDRGKAKFEYLMTHIAIDGVKNNDGGDAEGGIGINKFKVFNNVFVGHYHNHQEFKNIIYTGSTHPANFGEENEHKGIYVFYADGSFEFEALQFRKYVTQTIDPTMPLRGFESVIRDVKESDDHYRVLIEDDGTTDCRPRKLLLESVGAKVQIKKKDIILEIEEELDITQELTDSDLITDFEHWGKEKQPNNLTFGLQELKKA
jgi:DNA repair exonuclease SbcCD nuclease subunit